MLFKQRLQNWKAQGLWLSRIHSIRLDLDLELWCPLIGCDCVYGGYDFHVVRSAIVHYRSGRVIPIHYRHAQVHDNHCEGVVHPEFLNYIEGLLSVECLFKIFFRF